MTWFEKLDECVAKYLPDMAVEKDVPLSSVTSFHIGGPARRIAYPSSREQLVILIGLAQECGTEPFIMGNGTNLLIADRGLDRLVIRTAGQMTQVHLAEDTLLEADAGISLARLAVFAQKHSLSGLEFAHGIPGSLGGAVFMNAGAYGGEMKQVIEEVTVLTDSGIRRLCGEACAFGYRHSIFSDGKDIILGAKLRLRAGDAETIRETMNELMRKRKYSQPLEFPSAGSTFKRPQGHFAGTMIEQAGLKGLTVGGAQVSQKHAGFVINIGGATCEDVENLIAQVQEAVYQREGIRLEPEVKIIRQ